MFGFTRKHAVIASVCGLIAFCGVVYGYHEHKNVEQVLAGQESTISNLENRKSVLEASLSSGSGKKIAQAGLDESRVKSDTDLINAFVKEVSGIGEDASKRADFLDKYKVKDGNAFVDNILPANKPSTLSGVDAKTTIYCSGISGVTYSYVVDVSDGDNRVCTITLDTVSTGKTMSISNLDIIK